MITVSQPAADRLKTLIEEGDSANPYVRVSVKGGGCSGLSYDLSFDNRQDTTDTLAEDRSVKILIDKKSLLYLIGTELQFSD